MNEDIYQMQREAARRVRRMQERTRAVTEQHRTVDRPPPPGAAGEPRPSAPMRPFPKEESPRQEPPRQEVPAAFRPEERASGRERRTNPPQKLESGPAGHEPADRCPPDPGFRPAPPTPGKNRPGDPPHPPEFCLPGDPSSAGGLFGSLLKNGNDERLLLLMLAILLSKNGANIELVIALLYLAM